MKQRTLTRFQRHGKTTRRAQFLAEMERIIPWSELEAAIQRVYPKRLLESGRAAVPMPRLLRVYLLQSWFDLSDAAAEEALYDSATMREFAGVDAGAEAVPDEMTICRFRKLLADHRIGEQILAKAHLELKRNGITVTHERTAPPPPASDRTVSDKPAIELSLEAMGVGVFEYDPTTGVYRFSDRCKSIWGIEGEDGPTPERLHVLVHPDDRQLTVAACDSLKPDGPGEYSIEHRIIRPDGAVRWVHVCGRTAFHDTPAGRRALLSHGAMLDITERRPAGVS